MDGGGEFAPCIPKLVGWTELFNQKCEEGENRDRRYVLEESTFYL